MAAYRRVYDSRHLQADCQKPGSAPEPYARQSSMGYLFLFVKPHCIHRTDARWRRQDFVTGASEVWVYRGSEYEVSQSRLYCLCINVAPCSTAVQCICRVIRRSFMTMKAHTYYIIFGHPPIGGSFPLSPLAAPLIHTVEADATQTRQCCRVWHELAEWSSGNRLDCQSRDWGSNPGRDEKIRDEQ